MGKKKKKFKPYKGAVNRSQLNANARHGYDAWGNKLSKRDLAYVTKKRKKRKRTSYFSWF